MKKTVLEYTTDTYQEDIPKQLLKRKHDTFKLFFLRAGIRTEEREPFNIQIHILLRRKSP